MTMIRQLTAILKEALELFFETASLQKTICIKLRLKTTHRACRIHPMLPLILLVDLCLGCGNVMAEEHPHIPERPAIISQLDGKWRMTGDVMGKPVTYAMEARPVLQGAFTEIHMKDVQVPPEYEARVFIGYDSDSKTVIAHWMDSFGARYSIPHGSGTITENSIRFVIPYQGGSFRDSFSYDQGKGIWKLQIEAEQPDGSWKHFAHYDITRR